MENLFKRLASGSEYQDLITGLGTGVSELLVTGLTGSAKSLLVAALYQEELKSHNQSIVLLTNNLLQAQRLQDDLTELLGPEQALIFPDNELIHQDVLAASTELLEDRMRVLIGLATGRRGVYIIPYAAAKRPLVGRDELAGSLQWIKLGDELDLDRLLHRLVGHGYERVEMVERKGEFSLRGGILDVFPLTEEQPARVELFDTTVESIRSFNVVDQRSIGQLSAVLLTPVSEGPSADSGVSVLDYLDPATIVMIDEPRRVYETAKQQLEAEEESGNFFGYEELLTRSKNQRILFTLFTSRTPYSTPGLIVNYIAHELSSYHGQWELLQDDLKRWEATGHEIIFLAADEEREKRIERALDTSSIQVRRGNLKNGFIISSINLVVITEGELFLRQQRKLRRIDKATAADRIRSYNELKAEDYVVHLNHGIGIFKGIVTREFAGTHKDYLQIKYAKDDVLFVPTDQLGYVQKYEGGEGNRPKIYTLSGGDWKRVKSRVKSSVMDIAEDLIKLYAAREATVGFAFPADTEYHHEFASMFPYQETPDQTKVIEEISADMERQRPMDRLLCGDVGYGKTEVAIRAAFKAVYGGKQVAFLVPTTILAQQHYNTFIERLQDYPIKLAVLSRFTKRSEQTRILKELAAGTIDIIIGTHRLLSKDISFADIGLIIVDEEQKFGVQHKERIKQLRTNIDVLTLTATPIPRTLHMSMVGIRDLSIIETPPENRYPVQTYVLEYNEGLVRTAIEKELARGGQVYFLHNRVSSIERFAIRIRSLVPEARVAVAHGQMAESELEAIMLDFLAGDYDVLVTTTIIESGVDIPNVNTLIVSDADKMGLSQLYQLRGRVGRSNRVAYAYFTYQKDKVLTEIAEKRLVAIKEFTELGSGFKIAMRDLAIRGAGNLLGAEQSGYINSVGFELYNQLLGEAVAELKQTTKPEVMIEPVIDLPVDAYLPDSFISDQMQKIEMYKRFANIRGLEEAVELAAELADRFGKLPEAVENLLAITRIKTYLYKYKVESMTEQAKEVIIKINASQNELIDGAELYTMANNFRRPVKLSSHGQLRIAINNERMQMQDTLEMLEDFLEQYEGIIRTKGN